LLDRLEAQFRVRIRAELARAMGEMVLSFEHTGEVPPARDHHANVEALFRAMASQAATVFGARIIQQAIEPGKGFVAANLVYSRYGTRPIETKDFAETMARLALQYVAGEAIRRRIASIADTTRSQIVRAVAQGYSDGLGQAGVAGYIRDLIPSFTQERAARIARTETHGAANFGANEAARETGLRLRREWISSDDERTRESHALANGQIVGQDEPFTVGYVSLMYPGDPSGPASETINCRCAIGFVVDD